MGIRKKIMLGFLSLALLLFFSGMVSLFELNRLSTQTNNLLASSSRNMELSRRMLDAVQEQNTALLQMVVFEQAGYDSSFVAARRAFDKTLAEATVTIRDLSELDSIYLAREHYNEIVNNFFDQHVLTDVDWFVNVYKTSYYQLTSAIKNYMTLSQNSLGTKATQLKNNAYRAITPGILTLCVSILIVIMFYFLLNLYYTDPIIKITKGLQDYLTSRIPFNVKMEGKDEIFKLKEYIEKLIFLVKSK